MLKILKYMKQSAPAVLVIIVLLVIQATCDLSLPDYTSSIVNVGIQQKGIDSAAPEVLRKSTLDTLALLAGEDGEKISSQYEAVDTASMSEQELEQFNKQYPDLGGEALYQRIPQDETTVGELADTMTRPLLMMEELSGDSETASKIHSALIAMLPSQMQTQAADMSVIQILALLPEEARTQVLSGAQTQMDALPDSFLRQGAIVAIQEEYQELGINLDTKQTRYVLFSGAKMLAIAFASMAASILVGFFASRVAARLGMELRGRVFKKVVSFSGEELNHFSTASLITRSTNDIQQIQLLMAIMLRILFYAPILGIGGIIKVLNTDTSMGWIIVVAVAAILALVLVLFGLAIPRFKRIQKLVDRVNLVTREILSGLPVIRAFSTQSYEEKRFDRANVDLTKTNLFVSRIMAGMMPAMMLVMNGVTLLIVWNGGHAVNSGTMQVGDMMAFIQYTMQIIMAFLMVSMVSIMLPRASVSAVRIEEVLSTKQSIRDPQKPASFSGDVKGLVEFRDVSFHYPNAEEDVLSHISFTAKPGETTAFIGSTGSGKSTLLNLIPRFYDVSEGQILIDGMDIRDVSQHDLRAKLGYVPQHGILFSGTIASNIKYGKQEASDEEMKTAARIAQASDFVEEKPEGYDSSISQGGTNVSGGQKQRLSIARAIAVKPEIYLFDDSFSALDFKTEASLRRALRTETGKSTVLVVAQRINTIMHADQIVVLEEGKIAGIGTHRELMRDCEVYRQIAVSQLSKEELDI
ncbi:ABC transporter ATP-binding protein [Papillibacter cinnamivorans]|uniref:ATP-binding cassette, subfamily B n=1 Tax=Papillibacter cinnamivorans DSM 12816 TaxID=1122930 RepID=A0A1W2BSK4_9FIRM|nr:ABC transporter ATP-binding protein [Papillibacter cinnamivorans]SMC75957.1 ATP-binding cassette, subfamily B [Papillibacter cinnamivorans DSM 12816]